MDKIARLLAESCLRSGIIREDALEWCVYSFEKRLVTFFTWAVLLGVGGILAGIIPTLVFTICLLYLRSCTNGYHASRYLSCLGLSVLMEAVCLLAAARLPQHGVLLPMLAADLVIWVLAPANDPRIHLSAREAELLRDSARRRLALLNGLYLLLALDPFFSNCVAAALIADAAALFAAKKDRRSTWKTEVCTMKNELKQLIQDCVQGVVDRDMAKRTPGCIGWFYQPARPVQKDEEE